MKKIIQELKWLYYDTMSPLWGYYHTWILHRGKLRNWETFFTCTHANPFGALTPRQFERIVEDVWKSEL